MGLLPCVVPGCGVGVKSFSALLATGHFRDEGPATLSPLEGPKACAVIKGIALLRIDAVDKGMTPAADRTMVQVSIFWQPEPALQAWAGRIHADPFVSRKRALQYFRNSNALGVEIVLYNCTIDVRLTPAMLFGSHFQRSLYPRRMSERDNRGSVYKPPNR